MEECCSKSPRIFCNVCKQGACEKHIVAFKQNHPPDNMLSPTGREMFTCGRVPVTYFINEPGIVILMSPGEIYRRLREQK